MAFFLLVLGQARIKFNLMAAEIFITVTPQPMYTMALYQPVCLETIECSNDIYSSPGGI